MNKLIHIFALTLLLGCAGSRTPSEFRTGILAVEFCELPEHVGELVYIECTYSGVEEYWSIWGGKKCRPKLETELEFLGLNYNVPEQFVEQFQETHNNYWNTYLELKLIGRYDNSEPGYGHLGSNNGRFVVEEVIELRVVKKTKS
jgi:hypothetical protein